MFADVHCHLDQIKNPAEAIEKARQANVGLIITNSVDFDSIGKALELAKKFPEVKASIGLHPVDVLSMPKEKIEAAFQLIEKNAGNPAAVGQNLSNCVAIGEIGLDYKYAKTLEQRKLQEEIFRRHIGIAKANKLPIEVHSRFAEKPCLDTLIEEKAENVLMHWFTNMPKEIERAINLGFFISVGPSLLSFESTQQNVKAIPLENLMIETDSPVPYSGIPSEPAWAVKVAEKLAELKGLPFGEIEAITTQNARKLFKL